MHLLVVDKVSDQHESVDDEEEDAHQTTTVLNHIVETVAAGFKNRKSLDGSSATVQGIPLKMVLGPWVCAVGCCCCWCDWRVEQSRSHKVMLLLMAC